MEAIGQALRRSAFSLLLVNGNEEDRGVSLNRGAEAGQPNRSSVALEKGLTFIFFARSSRAAPPLSRSRKPDASALARPTFGMLAN
jgi:hypothetical protein